MPTGGSPDARSQHGTRDQRTIERDEMQEHARAAGPRQLDTRARGRIGEQAWKEGYLCQCCQARQRGEARLSGYTLGRPEMAGA